MFTKLLKFFILLGVVGLSSCTITKRYHSFGYHIETRNPVKLSQKGAEQQTALKKTHPTVSEEIGVGEKIESIKGANIISKPLSFVNAEFQRPLLQPINPQKSMTAVPMNLLFKEEMSNLLPISQVRKSYIAAKKQIIKKDKSSKKPKLALKGLLMMVAGILLVVIAVSLYYVAEMWAYVVVLLGLLALVVGGLMILYAFFKWLFNN
jgi:hypothetical protein